ncbi:MULTISPECIES: hypothetical protein [unclassified Mucilaginibacter]|uniref:hypothetical protein n=1 Tax=unclassified Mucilaginibacter TaxID=2617802 RepID=UPI002AC9B48E|nr:MULTISPECIES: hypothetical protein [unclassified Mucilaginibacter]MEB0263424.1 hypothetical protein [Mucilaginibacter sp. 10I4]MEB0280652.1 hypothetical protein [Mucilaginibacter sp. 10B2]MEB0303010.1 hypothetical protein [Mucilaginibacter sp. 5C4]WPX24268.1 hypothetical protein RHM67_03130 [Mucilaginibacter sp. 5C4]
MKHPFLKFSAIALMASVALVSCTKDKSTSTASSADVAFALTADNATSTVAPTSTSGLQTNGLQNDAFVAANASIKWTSAIANISRFKLEAKKGNTEIEITTKNISNLDLLAIDPATVAAKIDTGKYKEIEIKILLVKSAGADIPLTVKGTFTTAGGALVPIEFDYNDNAILKAEVENVTVDATTNVTAKLSFHLNKLLTAIPSSQIDAATRTNGAIIISSTSNAIIYNRVIANVLLAFEARGFEHHKK